MFSIRRLRTAAPCALLLAVQAAPALAQTSGGDKAAAEALFQEGRELLQQGKHDVACAKLAASQQLDAGVGTLLYLAECYVQSGRTASAWATFKEAASLARVQGQSDREQVARDRAAAVEPTLSRLEVHADAGTAGLEVRLNGTVIPRASWGTLVPIDPGPQRIEAVAPGFEPWSTTIDVPAGAGHTTIDIPPLKAVAAPVAASAPAVASAPPAPDERSGARSPVLGYVAAGAGVVGLAVGSIFGLRALSKNDESLDVCRTDTACPPNGVELREEAQDAALVSTIAFVAGTALTAGGIVWILTSDSSDASAGAPGSLRAAHVALTPVVGPREAGLALGGAF